MVSIKRFDLDHTWELAGVQGLGMLLVVLDRTPPVEGVSTGSVLSKTTTLDGGYSKLGGK